MKRSIVVLALIFSASAHAGLSEEMKQKLYPLHIVEDQGSCTFSPDASDTPSPCVVVEDDANLYAIVGVVTPLGTLLPLEVRRVAKNDRTDQETIWLADDTAPPDDVMKAEEDNDDQMITNTAVSDKLEYF